MTLSFSNWILLVAELDTGAELVLILSITFFSYFLLSWSADWILLPYYEDH